MLLPVVRHSPSASICSFTLGVLTRRLVDRSPDEAKIKQKMVFAASRDALRHQLVGISTEIQGTDLSEVAYETGKYSLI